MLTTKLLREAARILSDNDLVRSLRHPSVGWHEGNDPDRPLSISGIRVRAVLRAEVRRRMLAGAFRPAVERAIANRRAA